MKNCTLIGKYVLSLCYFLFFYFPLKIIYFPRVSIKIPLTSLLGYKMIFFYVYIQANIFPQQRACPLHQY